MNAQALRVGASTPGRRSNVGTEPLWTVGEVAAYLRLEDETVRTMARERRIPAIKVGKAWRFRASEIRLMLALHRNSAR